MKTKIKSSTNHPIAKRRFAALLALACALATGVHAATINVTSTADNGPGTLREALANVADGDTIDATGVSGTILLTSGELVVTNSVTILGPGPANLTVDGNHASRVFSVTSNIVVTIASLTIANGSSSFGGGILNDHSSLTVSNCTLSGNSAVAGGGIFNEGRSGGSAAVTVIASTLSGNSTSASGGGICNAEGTLTVIGCTLNNNLAGSSGGGIYNRGGTDFTTMLTVIASTFGNNSANGGGGAINNDCDGGRATVSVANSTLSGNEALVGGAISAFARYMGSRSTVAVANSTLNGNSASANGGGIANGAVLDGVATLDIGNTILKAGSPGVNIYDPYGGVTSRGFNLSSDDGGTFLTATGDQIDKDPLLGPLADNGGPTRTHLLLPGSPAIDKGLINTIGPLASDTDQRGFARTVDDLNIANAFLGDGTDIGAVEIQEPAPVNNPPVAKCKNVTVLAGPGGTASASIDDGSSDPDGNPITLVQTPLGPYPVGTTPVTLTVTDNHGAVSSCSATVTVQGVADLLVSLGIDKTSVKQGEQLTYTITVHNFGPQEAANVVINDTLSSGSTFVSAHANRGNFTKPPVGQTGTLTWNLGNLSNGDAEGAQLVVKVIVKGKTTITNVASASSNSSDPNPANNSAAITTTVAPGSSGGKQ